MSAALIWNGDTNLFGVESPVLRALKTYLIFPVPWATSEVRRSGSICRRVDALSTYDIISFKACQAISWSFVESIALRANWNAKSISIEETSCWAFDTRISRPCFAKKVAFRYDAGIDMSDTVAVFNNGSVVAGEALSGIFIPGVAKVTNRDADFFLVEIPSLGAGLADTIGPSSAANVWWSSGIDFRALAVNNRVSFKAFFANSFLKVKLLAGSLNLTAHSVFIEVISCRAFDAWVTAPDSTTEVVVKFDEEGRVVKLFMR
jgi:hypothetical protein